MENNKNNTTVPALKSGSGVGSGLEASSRNQIFAQNVNSKIQYLKPIKIDVLFLNPVSGTLFKFLILLAKIRQKHQKTAKYLIFKSDQKQTNPSHIIP